MINEIPDSEIENEVEVDDAFEDFEHEFPFQRDVVFIDGDARKVVGQLEFRENFEIAVVSVDDEHQKLVQSVVTSVNEKNNISLTTQPDGDVRFELGIRHVSRDESAFFDAIVEHFERTYGLALV